MRRRSAIHDGLVGARELVGTRYLADPALRAGYARDIAPRTEAALARVLEEIYGRGGAAAPARALDLGAGTGAVGRALRARFGERLEVAAVDAVVEPGSGVVRADLARELPAVSGRFDLVVAARRPARASGGTLVLVEPALRETSRELLAVRDLVVAGGLAVVAPCIWAGPCPALARDRDWCHDAASGRGGGRVDFSYLVLRVGGAPAAAPGAVRVVSDLLCDKGRLRLYGCGGKGRHLFTRLDRDASDANAAFADARRGDVLVIAGDEPAGEGARVGAAGTVTRR